MWPSKESQSAAIFRRAQNVLPGGISRLLTWVDPYPIYAKSGQGSYIEDADGIKRMDLMNNFASLIHGHAHPNIVEAVNSVITNGSCFALPTEHEIKLAELLCERVKSVEKVRFCNSGTEAVMIALKAARARTNRPKIAKIEGAYHGMYDHAEVSLESSPTNWGNSPKSTPHTRGTPKAVLEDTLVLPLNRPSEAEQLILSQAETLAAILIDPVPTNLGMIEMTSDFIEVIQNTAKKIGALLIIDEVIAFRLHYHGAQTRYGINPDLTTFAKIIGGGYPVGAICGTNDAMSVFSHENGKPLNSSSGTFTGNPISMAAGLTTMEMLTPAAYDRLDALGKYAREKIEASFKKVGFQGQVSGVGSMYQIHFHERELIDYRTAYQTTKESNIAHKVHRGMLDKGYILSPRCSGFLSTISTEDEIEQMAAAFENTLTGLA